MKPSHFLVFILFVITSVHATDPGVVLTIGGSVLESGISLQLPNILTSKVINASLPDIYKNQDFIVARLEYNITDIVISNFEIGEINVQIGNSGFEIDISSILCDATFNWSYDEHTLLIVQVKGSGTGTFNFSDGEYKIDVKIKEDDGVPVVDLSKNNFQLNHADLELEDGPQWFYDVMEVFITPIVKFQIQKIVQDTVSTAVGVVNHKIATVPTNYPLPGNIFFNWELLSDFDTSSDDGFGTFYLAGYFAPLSDISLTPPFIPPTLPTKVSNETFQLIISEYTFQSLGWALFEAGSLNITVPFGTTNDWRILLPSLYRSYPDDNIEVNFVSHIYPGFFLNSTGLTFAAAPVMVWNAITENGTETAFSLLIELEAQVDLYVNDTTSTIHGSIGVPEFDMSLQSSNIGQFSLFQLEAAINTAIYVIFLPTVNSVLREGIPIPQIGGLTLENPIIEFEQDFMYISTQLSI